MRSNLIVLLHMAPHIPYEAILGIRTSMCPTFLRDLILCQLLEKLFILSQVLLHVSFGLYTILLPLSSIFPIYKKESKPRRGRPKTKDEERELERRKIYQEKIEGQILALGIFFFIALFYFKPTLNLMNGLRVGVLLQQTKVNFCNFISLNCLLCNFLYDLNFCNLIFSTRISFF